MNLEGGGKSTSSSCVIIFFFIVIVIIAALLPFSITLYCCFILLFLFLLSLACCLGHVLDFLFCFNVIVAVTLELFVHYYFGAIVLFGVLIICLHHYLVLYIFDHLFGQYYMHNKLGIWLNSVSTEFNGTVSISIVCN